MAASDDEHDYYYYMTKTSGGCNSKLSGVIFEAQTEQSGVDEWLNTKLLPMLNDDLDFVSIQLGDNVNTEAKQKLFKSYSCAKLIQFIHSNAPKARVSWTGSWYEGYLKTTYKKACEDNNATFIDITDIHDAYLYASHLGAIYKTELKTTTYEVESFELDTTNKIATLHFNANSKAYTSKVPYEDFASDAGIHATITGYWEVITSAGIASHPGDEGMLKIANRMAYTLGWINNDGDIK